MKINHKNIIYFCLSLVILFSISCNRQVNVEKINPSLVQIYVNTPSTNERQSSFVVLDFVATKDNGFLFVGVGGVSVSSKFSKNAVLCLMKTDNAGNLLWEKYYNDINLGFGFPSNMITIDADNNEYVLFWNKYVKTNNIDNFEYYKVQFKVDNTSTAPKITPEKFNLEVRNNVISGTGNNADMTSGGYIVRGTPDGNGSNGYILMSMASNLKGIDNAQHIVLINRLSATLKTTWLQEPVIRGLSQGTESLKLYENHFQLFGINPYYYNIPDGNGVMSLANIGGTQTPIFRDSTSWVASVFATKTRTSLLLNADNQQDGYYYIPSVDLIPNNYNAATIANLGTNLLPALDNKLPAVLSETSDGTLMICGANLQTGAVSFKIGKSSTDMKSFELANNNYVAANITATSSSNLFAIGGTYNFGQNWKRPFIILIPKTEVFK
jgi:hypothetical protein